MARFPGLGAVWLVFLEVDQASITGVISLAQAPCSSGALGWQQAPPCISGASLSPVRAPKGNHGLQTLV